MKPLTVGIRFLWRDPDGAREPAEIEVTSEAYPAPFGPKQKYRWRDAGRGEWEESDAHVRDLARWLRESEGGEE